MRSRGRRALSCGLLSAPDCTHYNNRTLQCLIWLTGCAQPLRLSEITADAALCASNGSRLADVWPTHTYTSTSTSALARRRHPGHANLSCVLPVY